MKKVGLIWAAMAVVVASFGTNPEVKGDTVIIQLENGSRLVIYTKDKQELEDLKSYDFNKMIRDLNKAIEEEEIEYYELQANDGDDYRVEKRERIIIDNGDTTIVESEDPRRVRFTISVDDDDDDEEYEYRDRWDRRRKGNRSHFLLDIGINNWLEDGDLPNEVDAPYAVKNWGSWYVGLNWMNNTQLAGPFYLDWGAGVSWYNWKLEDPSVRITKGTDQIEFAPDTTVSGQKSKLGATYVNFMMVPMIDFSRRNNRVMAGRGGDFFKSYSNSGVRLGVGAYIGLRLDSKTKFIYEDGSGDEDRDKTNGSLFLDNVRYGIRGQIGYKGLDLFVMYDLNQVFVEDRGPGGAALNAISFGFSL